MEDAFHGFVYSPIYELTRKVSLLQFTVINPKG